MEQFPARFGTQGEGQLWVCLHASKLATQGAEPEGIQEAPAANLAGVSHPLPGPRLRPLVQEDDLGAVYNVRLDAGDVDKLRHLRHPDHVMV